ncbi:hypothetical protein CLOP_g20767 [Closterium sp. NIES-67]|nr:hypothetical protein CLOP_g20767 [Closterium sp. NIES-67]
MGFQPPPPPSLTTTTTTPTASHHHHTPPSPSPPSPPNPYPLSPASSRSSRQPTALQKQQPKWLCLVGRGVEVEKRFQPKTQIPPLTWLELTRTRATSRHDSDGVH